MAIDIEKYEREIRASVAEADAIADQAVAKGDAEAAFVKAQQGFNEARIQFALAMARLLNDGIDRQDILAAAGLALGLVFASIGTSVKDREEANAFVQQFQRASADGIAGEQSSAGAGLRTTMSTQMRTN